MKSITTPFITNYKFKSVKILNKKLIIHLIKKQTNSITLIVIAFIINVSLINGQVIVSQDFEGPLTSGWSSNGTLLNSQNSINAYAGFGMIALGQLKSINSPSFTLPSGTKNLSFWWTVASPSPLASISAVLKQNGSTIFTLGTWITASNWQQVGINIPIGYTGNNYSVTFTVQSSVISTNFYLDEIYLSNGSISTQIINNNLSHNQITIKQDFSNKGKLKIFSVTSIENAEIQINTIEGKVIFLKQDVEISNSTPYEIDLNEVCQGIYIVKFRNSSGSLVRKLIL